MAFTQINLLIASSDPQKLALFYSSIMGANITAGFTSKDFSIKTGSNSVMNFFKPSANKTSGSFNPPSLAICLTHKSSPAPMQAIQVCIGRFISIGAKLVEGPILEEFGAEAWFSDIEGNNFLFFVPLKHS